MNREDKEAVVERITGRIQESGTIFAVDYRGIDVAQIAELRVRLREADATFHVVKNTLAKRAAEKSGRDHLIELLVGPTAFAYVRGDVALAAKSLNKFVKDEKVMVFKGGLMDGDVLTAEQIESIARLPVAATLQAQLVGTLASPLTVLVRGLSSMIGGLAVALAQIQEQKAQQAPAEIEVPLKPAAEEQESKELKGTEEAEAEEADGEEPESTEIEAATAEAPTEVETETDDEKAEESEKEG